MPRTVGYPARRIALAVALTILGVALVAFAINRPRESSARAVAISAPVAPNASAPSTPVETVIPLDVDPASETPATAAPASAPSVVAAEPGMPHASAGMVVGFDPETGALGLPTKADRAALERTANLAPALDRSEAGLTVVHKPDGSKMIDLQGRFQEYMVVRLTPDGRKIESCVQGPDVEKALEGASAPADADAPAPLLEPRYEER